MAYGHLTFDAVAFSLCQIETAVALAGWPQTSKGRRAPPLLSLYAESSVTLGVLSELWLGMAPCCGLPDFTLQVPSIPFLHTAHS